MSLISSPPTVSASTLDIRTASDDRVVDLLQMAQDELARINEEIGAFVTTAKNELERRLVERGATAIPSQTHEVTLVPQWSAYRYNIDALLDVARNLPEAEAAKIVRHVPEEVIPAHVEAGAPVSIAALAKKYAGSEVGVRLAEAMQRDSLGCKLVVKARKTEPRPVQAAAPVTQLFERTVL